MVTLGDYIVEYCSKKQSLESLLLSLANEKYSSDTSVVKKTLNIANLISQALLDEEGSEDIWVNPINILPTESNLENRLEIRFFYGLLYHQLSQIPEFKNYLDIDNSNNIISIATKIHDLVLFVKKLNDTYNYTKSKDFNLNSTDEIITYVKRINEALSLFNTAINDVSEIYINDNIFDVSAKYISILEAMLRKDYQQAIPLF